MMDDPLLLSHLLSRAATQFAGTEVIGREPDGSIIRQTYAETGRRVRRLSQALADNGVKPGDRIASLAWNTRRHFELFHAIPSMGAVLHTLNPRFTLDDLARNLAATGARWIFIDEATLPMAEALTPMLPGAIRWVYMDDHAPGTTLDRPVAQDELIADASGEMDWPVFDERTAAVICFTSGTTTGQPKGVAYSHRSIFLSAMAMSLADWVGGYQPGALESIMPIAPMYHSNGWQMPYTAPMNGHRLVLPGRSFDAASLVEMLRTGNVTIAAGVPTIWSDIADHLDCHGVALPDLRVAMMAGMRVPERLFDRLGSHAISVRQSWGMTEAAGVGLATPAPGADSLPDAVQQSQTRSFQGRLNVLTRARIIDEDGDDLPHDGAASGTLLIRGPLVAESYIDQPAARSDGWLDTGDIAKIHTDGSLEMVDRKKDVIKSGGEWISSLEIEKAALSHPDISGAAAIPADHPKWQERPLLICTIAPGGTADAAALHRHIAALLPKWWLPDAILFAPALPLTGTGKVDKRALRAEYGNHLLETQHATPEDHNR